MDMTSEFSEVEPDDGFKALASEWAALDERSKMLKAEIDAHKERMAQIEPVLLEHMADMGMESMRLLGRTVYIQTQLWAATPDKSAAVEALKESGYGNLVSETFNANSLSAVIREFDREGKELPPEWSGVIGVSSVVKLRARKSP